MISPTPRAIFLMLLGVPLMLAIALMAPALWTVSAGWIVGVGALILMDAMLGASLRAYKLDLAPPALLYVGGSDPLPIVLSFADGPLPRRIQVQLETNEILEDIPAKGLRGWDGRERPHEFALTPKRRGMAKLVRMWSR